MGARTKLTKALPAIPERFARIPKQPVAGGGDMRDFRSSFGISSSQVLPSIGVFSSQALPPISDVLPTIGQQRTNQLPSSAGVSAGASCSPYIDTASAGVPVGASRSSHIDTASAGVPAGASRSSHSGTASGGRRLDVPDSSAFRHELHIEQSAAEQVRRANRRVQQLDMTLDGLKE